MRSAGREAGKLWLDVTSIKSTPVAALLASRAEVAGLHPLTAPPKSPTLKGRVLAVCRARVDLWSTWLESMLTALEAECVEVDPERHDHAMALVQALGHASHLAHTGVLNAQSTEAGTVARLLPMRSVAFEMDVAIAARILEQNPAIYEDIQFCNPHVPGVLRQLSGQIESIAQLVEQGDAAARGQFRAEVLEANRIGLGTQVREAGNHTFERIGYLLSDLADARSLSVHVSDDRSGSLRALLEVFEARGVNIASLHSSRTRAGELHFRFGFESGTEPAQLAAIAVELHESGQGRVLSEC